MQLDMPELYELFKHIFKRKQHVWEHVISSDFGYNFAYIYYQYGSSKAENQNQR